MCFIPLSISSDIFPSIPNTYWKEIYLEEKVILLYSLLAKE